MLKQFIARQMITTGRAKGVIRWLSEGDAVLLDGDRGVIELVEGSRYKIED